MTAIGTPRPQLKIRRVNLDTGRENVAVISRRSMALRPEVFRGFSRVELRCNSKVLLATLLLTDDGLVNSRRISVSPTRRSAAWPGRKAGHHHAGAPPASMRCAAKFWAAR